MDATQRVFLADLVDYAGLFPPARLSLDEAVRNYARYRREPEAWMLARFVCPAGHLGELSSYITELFSRQTPLRVSTLGSGGETDAVFLENLRLDLEAVARFRERHQDGAVVECFETRLPPGLTGEDCRRASRNLLVRAADLFAASRLASLSCFYEIPLPKDCRQTANAVAYALAALNRRASRTSPPGETAKTLDHGMAGIKLRCGGLGPAAIPSTAQVATVIQESVHAGVPLKFTAGLHQPVRRVDPCLGVYVHGFLNLFAAGVLADALDLDFRDIAAIIEEEDFRAFRFSEDCFTWDEAGATLSEVQYARRHRVVSFGSCSFDEPLAGLRELEMI
jgi:hypothetical protein